MTNNELNIQCPHCGEAFELTEALAAPLLQNERNKTEAEVSRRLNAEIEAIRKQARDAAEVEAASKIQAAETQAAETSKLLKDAQAKELAVRKDREKLQQERAAMDLEVQRRVDAEKKRAIEVGKAAASKEWEAKLQALQSDVNAKDARLREAERAELEARQLKQQAEEQKRQLELTITRRLQEERAQVVAEARAAAEKDWQTRLEAATSELASKNAKLQEAERAELEARKLKAKAEDAMRQAELTVVRRLDEERAKVREEAMRERDVEHRLKLGEKDKQLDEMRAQIEELRRKGDRAPQQLVGEILELDLFEILSQAFPTDQFERTRKGQGGADVLQTVRTPSGIVCGRILWETKRTKSWNSAWLAKLREDQRAAKADIAALVSETLPEHIRHFDQVESIWVSSIELGTAMASALRQGLMETARARAAAEGADAKKDLTYNYLTGSEFKQRVRGVLDPLVVLQQGLLTEKASTQRQWSLREKQLEKLMRSISGMYGDLQGIVGTSLPTLEGLSMTALEGPGEPANAVALDNKAA